eukprot:scaffold248092_cov48-Tisochrysis_lutea.AAC.1
MTPRTTPSNTLPAFRRQALENFRKVKTLRETHTREGTRGSPIWYNLFHKAPAIHHSHRAKWESLQTVVIHNTINPETRDGRYIHHGGMLGLPAGQRKITEWSKARLAYATSDYMDLLRKKGVSPPPAPEEQDLAPQQDPDAHDLGDIRVDKELNYYIRRGGDYHE